MEEELKASSYFSVQQKMLSLCGLSLNEEQSTLYKMYSWSLFTLFFLYICFLTYDAVIYMDDIDIVTNSIYHGLGIVMTLFKFWIFTSNRTKLNKTLNLLQQGVFSPNKERGGDLEEMWIKECITNSNRLMIAGCVLSMTTISLRVTPSIIKRFTTSDAQQWQPPFSKYGLFNPSHSPNFEFAWLYQSVVWSMISMAFVVTDYFIMSVFAHICTQFKMLRNSINRIVADDFAAKKQLWSERFIEHSIPKALAEAMPAEEVKPIEATWGYLRHKLKQCIIYHEAIMDLTQQLEDILNMFVLTNYVGDTVVFACIMYHGSLYPLTDTRFQRDVTLITVMSFQLFLISYFGNEVTLESQEVMPSCYEAKFFDVDIRLQKGLNIITTRSQKPITFTIGKFANLSLITFVSLMRLSFSYYMVLHNMNQ